METPDPPETVELFPASVHHSRPVPVFGVGEGVFQAASPGKYINECNYSPSDAPSLSSAPAPQVAAPGHNLNIYYQNVNGLKTKIDDFFLAVFDSSVDVVVLTETGLDDSVHSAQLFGNAYTVYRTDRSSINSRRCGGGGVLIAVSSRLSSYLDRAPISNSIEQIWVRVNIRNRCVSIGVFYLPPERKNDPRVIENHIESIGSVMSRLNPQDLVLQFGDYNQSDLVWRTSDSGAVFLDTVRSRMSSSCSMLLDGLCFHGLIQINTIMNINSRVLDLILVNDAALPKCSISEAIDPLTRCDVHHPALNMDVEVPSSFQHNEVTEELSLDFRRTDFDSLRSMISQIDWSFLDLAPCLDIAVDRFSNAILQTFTECVPLRRPAQKPPWSNARLRNLKRLRSSALRNFCNSRSPYYKQQLKHTSNRYRSYNRYLYKRYVRRMEANLRRNPKSFWAFVNSKRKDAGMPSSMYLDQLSCDNAQEKCDLFASHFKRAFNSVTASSEQVNLATQNIPYDAFDYDVFHITEDMVAASIKKLKFSTIPGPDGIPSSVLKNCASELVFPLTKLFNRSMQQGQFPSRWKYSFMFPVYKKGNKCNIANYRGITSLSVCSKVFEVIVNDMLFTCSKNYISSDQHGFYPKRSVSTNLVEFTSVCFRSMDGGGQIDAIYTDLKAAFDRVDHAILLKKLQILGVSSASVAWFRSYLTDRQLCVRIGASQSEPFSNPSGVPQGSNLGPLLFSIFLNDVSLLLTPGCRLFYADDVKIFKSIHTMLDCLELQHLLDIFQVWCSNNLLTLSYEKCNVISFHRKLKPITFNYEMSGQPLERVEQIKDLGVTLDRELTFRTHYSNIIAKANRQLGFVCKVARDFRDIHCLKSLYCALVRSILESNAVVWCPFQTNWITRIESTQRRFVRYALRNLHWRHPVQTTPYSDRCQLLGIDTLTKRRQIAQVVFVAKVLTGETDSPAILALLNVYAPQRLLRTRPFLYLGARSTEYGLHDPIRFMSWRFNDVFEMFDFNIPVELFRQRLLISVESIE